MLAEFIDGYVDCALWASTNESGEPLDETYSIYDIDADSLESMREDCTDFFNEHEHLIGTDYYRAGMDFWLTRNRHGAGFWDGDWPKPAATILTDAAHVYGSSDLYEGDDGKLYLA